MDERRTPGIGRGTRSGAGGEANGHEGDGRMGEVIRMEDGPNVERREVEVTAGEDSVVVCERTEGSVTLAAFGCWSHDQQVELERASFAAVADLLGAPDQTTAGIAEAAQAYLAPEERYITDLMDLLDANAVPYVFRSEKDKVEQRRG